MTAELGVPEFGATALEGTVLVGEATTVGTMVVEFPANAALDAVTTVTVLVVVGAVVTEPGAVVEAAENSTAGDKV